MKIKNSDVDLIELVKRIDFDSYKLYDNGKGLLLNNFQVGVLERWGIEVDKYTSVRSLIFDIDSCLNEGCDDEELEEVVSSLMEFYYYNEVRK